MKRPPRLDLNPSAADRWTTCTASPAFILANADKLPPDDGTQWSQEGTLAHEVAAATLLGEKQRAAGADADMLWHGWNYAEYVQGLRTGYGRLLVEQKLPLWYMPGRNAIIDAAIINPQEIHVIDYKYGEGVAVHPEGNLQATIYATIIAKQGPPLGHEFPIFIHIYQPRGRNAAESPFHVWETTWGVIENLAIGIEHIASQIQKPRFDGTFVPSEKACQFCPAKGFCSARHDTLTKDIDALAVIQHDEIPDLPAAGTIGIKQLAAILKHKDQLVKWLNDASAYALQMMKAGTVIPGFKLVTSRGGNRYWTNPKAAEKLLLAGILKRSEVIEEKVITPAAAEKLIGKLPVDLLDLVAKPPGQPVIASEDDKREGIGGEVDAFDDLTSIEDF